MPSVQRAFFSGRISFFYYAQLLFTIHTHACYHHGGLRRGKAIREFYGRYGYIIQAKGFIAIVANKMHMIIVVATLLAIVFAKGI